MAKPSQRKQNYSSPILAAIFAAIAFYVSYTNSLLPIEQLLYDRVLRYQASEENTELVIVAMDEKSLQRYGSLPWPRKTHAQLIDRLTEMNVKAVGYDVLFDKVREGEDQALVRATKKNGKVVYPVIIEKVSQSGELIELMPHPELIQASNKLGVVHFELGKDNIARSTYLKVGLGEPFWRSFAVEVLDVALENGYQIPIESQTAAASYDLTKIEKDNLVFIPFKQDHNHFKRVSFVDLVDSDPKALDAIRGKVVFVGVTATAARNADFLPVPVDRSGQVMPGVEINATLFEALKNKTNIAELPLWLNSTITAFICFIAFILLPKSLPRRSLFYGIIFLSLCLLTVWYLLHHWHIWAKAATLCLTLMAGYLIWIWQKIVVNMSFFKTTVERLSLEMKHSISPNDYQDIKSKLKFLTKLELIDAHEIENINSDDLYSLKEIEATLAELDLKHNSESEKQLFNKLIKFNNDELKDERPTYGVIENRIKNLEAAIQQMNFLRRFVEQTMNRMSDAIILSDTDGRIFFSNLVAKRFLTRLTEKEDLDLFELLSDIKLQNNELWPKQLRKVLQAGVHSELIGTVGSGMDVKVSLSLLDNVSGRDFLSLNIVDISAIKREQRRQLEMIDFISHDLRSPMTSILALLSRSSTDSDVNHQAIYQEVEKLTRSSLSLAEQFLMLSRTESNIQLAIYPVELLDTIDNAIAIVMPQATNKKISIKFDFFAYKDIWLNTNQDLMERVITNILSNAIKYSPKESEVLIDIETSSKEIQLKIKDQGEGISTEQMEAIFKPFTRMQKHEMAKIKGIGLGLRFVRAAMLRFEGQVAVESEIGRGATFILKFPSHLIVVDE